MEQAPRIPERYTLIEEVGQGGMAIVYRAQDETLKREVAIKVLHQHLAGEPESRARLEREAQAVAKLRHDNILEIFDYSGLDSATSYIVTEFIDGQTLKQYLNRRPLGFPEVAALIASEVCGALAHAHAAGVIHRDIKPENVMIRKDGLIKLMDFGIAQILDFQRMTVTGQLLGSPAYMAPEIIEGKPLDFRTDVFSVGIMLYLLATGALPFAGKNPHEVLRRITDGKFPDPRTVKPGVDQVLARMITRALARRPDDRYPDVALLAADLAAYLAEAGLQDVRGELRLHFADPAAYEAALPRRLAAALTVSAAAHLAAGRRVKALELWNRVLAFDPENAAVTAALHRLEGRRRLRTAGVTLGIAVVFGAAGASVVHRVHSRPGNPTWLAPVAGAGSAASRLPIAPLAPPEPRIAIGTSGASAHSGEPAHRGPTPGIPANRPRAEVRSLTEREPPAARGGSHTFTLGPTPQNVDVYMDGHRQFGYDLNHTTLAVPWKTDHVIEFRSPTGCCFVERIDVGPNHPLPPDAIIARRLKWRPAHLLITTEPVNGSARVLVRDPSRQGTPTTAHPGEEIDVPFFADDDASKEIEIAVDSGELYATEKIRVRAGERSRHVVKLKAGAN
jgi:tRNA A-37 threonylcarbamoyl transferase component Bud32